MLWLCSAIEFGMTVYYVCSAVEYGMATIILLCSALNCYGSKDGCVMHGSIE